MGRVIMTTKNDEARAGRLKAALRENLRRRKVQVRERAQPDGCPEPAEPEARPDEPVGEPTPDTR